VDAESQMSSIEGLFAAGECASGINGANRLAATRLSILIRLRQARRRVCGAVRQGTPGQPRVDEEAAGRATTQSLAPFDRGRGAENPYNLQQDLQDAMQNLVRIVRTESEMREALNKIDAFQRAG